MSCGGGPGLHKESCTNLQLKRQGTSTEGRLGTFTRLLMEDSASPIEKAEKSHDLKEDDTLNAGPSGKLDVSKEARKPAGAIRKSTPSSRVLPQGNIFTMKFHSLNIPGGRFVVDSMAQFARANSRPGVALCILGGSGTVCNLKLQGPWKSDLLVAGNVEIVTISATFQFDWWGSMKSTSLAIMVSTNSGNVIGGTVNGDMQAVGQVVLNACLFVI